MEHLFGTWDKYAGLGRYLESQDDLSIPLCMWLPREYAVIGEIL